MNLVQESRRTIAWLVTVLRAFFRVRPWTTLALILAVTFSRICNLLAFFLPLKVILLAGSDGLPQYFQSYVDPAHKMKWIMVLSVGAVVLYALSLVLISASQRLAKTGSSEILQAANELAVASRQRNQAKGYYATITAIAADMLLPSLGLVALAFIDLLLLVGLTGLIVAAFLATAWVLQRDNPLDPGSLQTLIRTKPADYLRILSSAGVLFGFFAILVPFLLGRASNLLLAILALLILRQALTALSRGIKDAVSLWKIRLQIDPLVFRERQLHRPEPEISRSFRQVFAKAERERAAADALALAGHRVDELNSEWCDSRIRDVHTFVIHARPSGNGRPRLFQQQVFTEAQRSLLEHEEFLFSHCDRDLLRAPDVVAKFDVGPFATQICDYGTGELFPRPQWKEVSAKLIAHYWAFRPPPALVTAFKTSHPTLQGRLSTGFLERLTVALEDREELVRFDRFMATLPALHRALGEIPIYIHNPDMKHTQVVASPQGEPLVMQWGHWAIEPIGTAVSTSMGDDAVMEAVAVTREARDLSEVDLTSDHVRLASECSSLERHLLQRAYRQALEHIPVILSNTIVERSL